MSKASKFVTTAAVCATSLAVMVLSGAPASAGESNRVGGSTSLAGTGPIVHWVSGKCMDVAGNGDATGTAVQIQDCDPNSTAQLWTLAEGTIGAKGKCLDGGDLRPGTELRIRDCNGGANQRWQRANFDRLYNPTSNLCINLPGGNAANGTRLDIEPCARTGNMVWVVPAGTV
ncbi:ricin-type beta-trefoil lectin domain protein (plasmid) [Embleya sp. NBC_00888]|uniref:RICIN domain-containing protein n=1 Tax=Embleya sp. NBC_00888 TaxID=2975960 RepID=UPI002F912F78|nr:ricin-type beta-trefoil lectin domain protein [Embleya sp. NBC_00888]